MAKKEAILRNLAVSGYNIGISAKRHFKSYDILRLSPKGISVFTISIGILQMTDLYKEFSKYNATYTDLFSAILIIIGICGFVADVNSESKGKYNHAGTALIELYNELHLIYNEVKIMNEDDDFSKYSDLVRDINKKSTEVALSEQIIFSGWLSHLGFFDGEMQIDWINEQLNLAYKDRLPTSFRIVVVMLLLILAFGLYKKFS